MYYDPRGVRVVFIMAAVAALLRLGLVARATGLVAVEAAASGGAAGVFDVLKYGAKGDGAADDGTAIAAAYSACAAAGGGTVLFRSGHIFRSGPIDLSCNDSVTTVQAGATILARNSTAGWPFGLDCPEPAQGKTPKQMAPMLLVAHGRNVTVNGGGVVDANGEMWWDGACGNWWCRDGHAGGATAFRPFLFRIDHSTGIRVHNVSLRNSGFWTLVPVHSSGIEIIGVNVSAAFTRRPPHWPADRHDLLDTPNTDGIEPMWSRDVFISHVRVINGDDCITVKSGSRDILVEDLYCEHGDGLTIGSIWYSLTPHSGQTSLCMHDLCCLSHERNLDRTPTGLHQLVRICCAKSSSMDALLMKPRTCDPVP